MHQGVVFCRLTAWRERFRKVVLLLILCDNADTVLLATLTLNTRTGMSRSLCLLVSGGEESSLSELVPKAG